MNHASYILFFLIITALGPQMAAAQVQTRTVTCRDTSTGLTVSDSLCNPAAKPAISQTCLPPGPPPPPSGPSGCWEGSGQNTFTGCTPTGATLPIWLASITPCSVGNVNSYCSSSAGGTIYDFTCTAGPCAGSRTWQSVGFEACSDMWSACGNPGLDCNCAGAIANRCPLGTAAGNPCSFPIASTCTVHVGINQVEQFVCPL